MYHEQYCALFEELVDYRTPDGTIVQALWTGSEPIQNDSTPPYWILAPNNPRDLNADHWQYEVQPNGAVIVQYYSGLVRSSPNLPSQIGPNLCALPFDLLIKPRFVEQVMTDLTADDFTKVE